MVRSPWHSKGRWVYRFGRHPSGEYRRQSGRIHRFGEMVVHSGIEASFAIAPHGMGGHGDSALDFSCCQKESVASNMSIDTAPMAIAVAWRVKKFPGLGRVMSMRDENTPSSLMY